MDTKEQAEFIIKMGDTQFSKGHIKIAQAYLTQCQEVERLNKLLDEFWDMRTVPYEFFKSEMLNRLREFSKEDKQ